MPAVTPMTSLADLLPGQRGLITSISDTDVALQALRLGIFEGEVISCVAKIPSGPTVIQRGGMELAIGKSLCEHIEVNIQ